jgi:hypothetical protein
MATKTPTKEVPMTSEQLITRDVALTKEFMGFKEDTKHDVDMRINGVVARRGSTGKQFSGYRTLEQFYRGDQWDHDEPAGASQRTDNYCAVIVDNLSSLLFDDSPEINCPTDDPTDDMLEVKAELKEKFLRKVWEDNDYEVEFDEWSKQGSLYGDAFMLGPYMEKVDKMGNVVDPESTGDWKIRFRHIEDPGTIRLIFADSGNRKLLGFIHSDRIPLTKAQTLYGELARSRGIKIVADLNPNPSVSTMLNASSIPMVNIETFWDAEKCTLFINDKLLKVTYHRWGFVPLNYVKNNYVPNYPYGKSDIEDVLDPQLAHNRTNNDLANLLKWISSVNLWGKNLEGMQALVAGLSRIYSLPEDGELHAFEKTGDPYVANTYVQQRRTAIVEMSGVSEALLSGSQAGASSGRALALAFQGTIRKLNPRAKRYRIALKHLNENILKLAEIYFPESKKFIESDYRNEVYLPSTLLRNIVDTINKFQSGLISQDTAMREAGVAQPNLERRIMVKDLMDPVLGPQVARQPSLLPRLSEGENQPGDNPAAAGGAPASASQDGAVSANNSQASGGKPVPK